jgi:perosamine synthetase
MNRLFFFFNKIPRTRIYVEPTTLFKSLFEVIFKEPERGDTVKEFERVFSLRYGGKRVLALPFARIAFYYILKALDIREGSEVLMTPITIPDMVNMIRCLGLKPVFVDFEKNTYNVDFDDLEKKINEKSSVLLITYLCGLVPDMDKIIKMANRYNIILLEDCSQNFGAKYKNTLLGTLGEAGFFSTGILKALSTYNGGMVISDNERLLNKIEELINRDFTIPPKKFSLGFIIENLFVWFLTQRLVFSLFTYYMIKLLNLLNPDIISRSQTSNVSLFFGGSPRLMNKVPNDMLYFYTDMQADAGLEVLKTIDISDERRINNAKILLENLSNVSSAHLPRLTDECRNIFWRFPIKIKDYKNFQKYLFNRYIDTSRTNLTCCSSAPFFKIYKMETPEAEEAKEDTVYIPVEPSLSERQMRYIADTINEYFQKFKDNN